MDDVRSAAQVWWHATQARICDRIEPFAYGTLVRADWVPSYYDYNLLRVEKEAEPAILAAEADRLLAGLEHRKVQVDDEALGRSLRPGFDALGWRTERLVWMAHEGSTSQAPAPPGVELVETDRETIKHLRLEWTDHWTPEQVAGFVPIEDRVCELLGVRVIAARRDGGPAIGFVQWRTDGEVAEMMLAYVTPEERNNGIGGALVAESVRLARAAGAQLVLIAADDEEDAKRLYERLGFRTVWTMHDFTLEDVEG